MINCYLEAEKCAVAIVVADLHPSALAFSALQQQLLLVAEALGVALITKPLRLPTLFCGRR